jgi:hypothetical protein
MSTFKIASKFKTEAEKKAEEHAILDAAWAAVPPYEEAGPRVKIMKKTTELLEEDRKKTGVDYQRILERLING